MNREELKKYLKINNKSGYKTREKHIKNNFPELYLDILKWSRNFLEISFLEKLYLFITNINTIPKCPTCGGLVKFEGKINKGYRKHCSIKCSNNDDKVKSKIRSSNKIAQNSNEVKNKIKQSNIEKYGVEHSLKLNEYKEKRKQTNIKKYGVDHHLKLKSQQQKQKQTNIEKYGKKYVGQVDEFKEKIKQTNIEKYGVDNIFKSEKFKNNQIKNQKIKF